MRVHGHCRDTWNGSVLTVGRNWLGGLNDVECYDLDWLSKAGWRCDACDAMRCDASNDAQSERLTLVGLCANQVPSCRVAGSFVADDKSEDPSTALVLTNNNINGSIRGVAIENADGKRRGPSVEMVRRGKEGESATTEHERDFEARMSRL